MPRRLGAQLKSARGTQLGFPLRLQMQKLGEGRTRYQHTASGLTFQVRAAPNTSHVSYATHDHPAPSPCVHPQLQRTLIPHSLSEEGPDAPSTPQVLYIAAAGSWLEPTPAHVPCLCSWRALQVKSGLSTSCWLRAARACLR